MCAHLLHLFLWPFPSIFYSLMFTALSTQFRFQNCLIVSHSLSLPSLIDITNIVRKQFQHCSLSTCVASVIPRFCAKFNVSKMLESFGSRSSIKIEFQFIYHFELFRVLTKRLNRLNFWFLMKTLIKFITTASALVGLTCELLYVSDYHAD